MTVETIELPTVGNRCHLVHDGSRALVVDPPRDHRVVEERAEAVGVEIVAVADTHVHNDFVSGAPALARRHGADHLLSADEHVTFPRTGVRGGDRLSYGSLEVEVLAAPGHTRHHQAFVVRTPGARDALLSGGSLLHGTVGRPDLIDPALTDELAAAQWHTARRLAGLDPTTRLLPTHGFGSFCAGASVPPPPGPVTMGDLAGSHPALTQDQEHFVRDLLAGLGPIPAYYPHMGILNRIGVGGRPPRAARPLDADAVRRAVAAGQWVIDLRERSAFAHRHLPGTVGIERGDQAATYVGWLVPWSAPLVLLSDAADDLEQTVQALAAIGIEGVGTHVLEATATLRPGYRRADWTDWADRADRADGGGEPTQHHPRIVLDVRQVDEWRSGHLPGASHLPVQQVAGAGSRLPPGEVWVHCRSGYRAAIAASLLHREGRDVVHVDDSWDRVADLGIPTVAAA